MLFFFKIHMSFNLHTNIEQGLKETLIHKIEDFLVSQAQIPICLHLENYRPLFFASKQYNSFSEIEEFYERNINSVSIIDDSFKEYNFNDFKNIVTQSTINNEKLPFCSSKIEKPTSLADISVFHFDNNGFEFTSKYIPR